ncbi:MAG: hypothetical protein ABIJ09_26740 [Pseudomonadota bacterium]
MLRLGLCTLVFVLTSCKPQIAVTLCASDGECPAFSRCDRALGYCRQPRDGEPICDALRLAIRELGDAEGAVIQVVVRDARDLAVLARFEAPVRDQRVDQRHPFAVLQGRRYLVDAFLDVDDNQTCGAGDRVWRTQLQTQPCPALAQTGDPLGRPQDRCAPFGLTGDLNGDGCVDELDLDRLLADYGLTGEQEGDLDGNGIVDLTDLSLLLANYCAGEPACCQLPDGGVQAAPPVGLRGDADCNRRLGSPDIAAFAQCRDDPAGFAEDHPRCPRSNCDANCDGRVDDLDLPILSDCVIDQICTCP